MNELLDDRLEFMNCARGRSKADKNKPLYRGMFPIVFCWRNVTLTVCGSNRYGEPGPAAREVNSI